MSFKLEPVPVDAPPSIVRWLQKLQAVLTLKQAPSTPTLSGSPATLTAAVNGTYVLSGGTVSLVQFQRGTFTLNYTGSQYQFPVSAGDQLIITYTAAPTVTFIPS